MIKGTEFIGCEGTFENSDIVIFGAPFDGTTSYRPGARFAPAHIRNESYSIETYSPYLDKDLEDYNVYDAGDLDLPFGNTEKVLAMIKDYTKNLLDNKKIPFMIGGEHLVTYGAFQSVYEKYQKVHIVHFDAHTDLREDYLGEKLSHACVIKRCYELVGDNKIFQFGIRSGERDEFYWAKEHTHLQKNNFDGLENILNIIGNNPVYFTIDLDVLDPSGFPGTGTPEAGGVSFIELLNAIKIVTKLNVVALDINELSPPWDNSGISTSLACKVVRELILSIGK